MKYPPRLLSSIDSCFVVASNFSLSRIYWLKLTRNSLLNGSCKRISEALLSRWNFCSHLSTEAEEKRHDAGKMIAFKWRFLDFFFVATCDVWSFHLGACHGKGWVLVWNSSTKLLRFPLYLVNDRVQGEFSWAWSLESEETFTIFQRSSFLGTWITLYLWCKICIVDGRNMHSK